MNLSDVEGNLEKLLFNRDTDVVKPDDDSLGIDGVFDIMTDTSEILNFDSKIESVAKEALELALANEIETHSPWVDVGALASSVVDRTVSVGERETQSVFAGATFVPTRVQSYVDLNGDASGSVVMETDAESFMFDAGASEIDKLFDAKPTQEGEISSYFDGDESNAFGTESLEINAANSVLFNADLNLEDTLLFDNEPPSDMYVVKTENIFKDVAKRSSLRDITADADICKCSDCKCDPTVMQCQSDCNDVPEDASGAPDSVAETSAIVEPVENVLPKGVSCCSCCSASKTVSTCRCDKSEDRKRADETKATLPSESDVDGCRCSDTVEGCCIVICLRTLEGLRQLMENMSNYGSDANICGLQKCSEVSAKYSSFALGCNNATMT